MGHDGHHQCRGSISCLFFMFQEHICYNFKPLKFCIFVCSKALSFCFCILCFPRCSTARMSFPSTTYQSLPPGVNSWAWLRQSTGQRWELGPTRPKSMDCACRVQQGASTDTTLQQCGARMYRAWGLHRWLLTNQAIHNITAAFFNTWPALTASFLQCKTSTWLLGVAGLQKALL